MLDPFLTPRFIKELVEDISLIYSKLLQVNGCRYYCKITYEFNSFYI